MSKDMAKTGLSILEGHCWRDIVQEHGGQDGLIGFNAGRNAARGEIADRIRQVR